MGKRKTSKSPSPTPVSPTIEYFQPKYTPFLVAKWQTKLTIPGLIKPKAKGETMGEKLTPEALWPSEKFGTWNKTDLVPEAFQQYTGKDPDQADYHGVAPEYFNRVYAGTDVPYYSLPPSETLFYEMGIARNTAQLVPKVVKNATTGAMEVKWINSPVASYFGIDGQGADNASEVTYHGPTFKTKVGQQVMTRQRNYTDEYYSTHLHGAHTNGHGDGFPTYVIAPGNYRDYFSANTVPWRDADHDGEFDDGEYDFHDAPSSMWYHDHGMRITNKHVLEGASAIWMTFDDLELDLLKNGVLPGYDAGFDPDYVKANGYNPAGFDKERFMANPSPYDVPLVISDITLNADGTIRNDIENDDGELGDIALINGKAYPEYNVNPTQYRFRILNGSVARFQNLILEEPATGANPSFMRIGKDTWLYPQPIENKTIYMSGAQRADVVVDFSKYKPGDVIYLKNILEQTSGKGPKGTADDPQPITGERILKFVVQDPNKDDSVVKDRASNPILPKASVAYQDNPSTVSVKENELRPNTPIYTGPDTVVDGTRYMRFERTNGQWVISDIIYEAERADVTPTLDRVEKWVLQNNSGGWAHPLHIHLEAHQIVKINGHAPRPEDQWKNDTVVIDPNGVVEIYIQFRSFEGPFMMHCHILDHEDHEMMANIDIAINPKDDNTRVSRQEAPPSLVPWDHDMTSMSGSSDTLTTASLGGAAGHGHGSHGPGSSDRGPHSGLPWYKQDRKGGAAHGADGQGVDSHNRHAHGTNGAEHCELEASAAKNTTFGSKRHDCIQGTSSSDRIRASRGHDEITAGDGDDWMKGGRGADILHGGRGSDWMMGGKRADLFCFEINDMHYGDIDTIADFKGKRGDRLELLGADATSKLNGVLAWRFIDGGAYSGHRGEIRFDDGFLEADIDGDRLSDLMVRLEGAKTFKAEWLLSDGQAL